VIPQGSIFLYEDPRRRWISRLVGVFDSHGEDRVYSHCGVLSGGWIHDIRFSHGVVRRRNLMPKGEVLQPGVILSPQLSLKQASALYEALMDKPRRRWMPWVVPASILASRTAFRARCLDWTCARAIDLCFYEAGIDLFPDRDIRKRFFGPATFLESHLLQPYGLPDRPGAGA
jgi:hypothetical protein